MSEFFTSSRLSLKFLLALIAPTAFLPTEAAFAQSEDLAPVDGYGDEDDSADAPDEIIVQAMRSSFTLIETETPDASFSAADIAALGVSDINELLEVLSAETQSGSEAPPVLLLDGRPVASKRDVQRFPSEAVLRVEILPPEAALKFSSDPDRRVINFVLRRRFNAITSKLDAGVTTDGGRDTYEAGGSFLRIYKKSRIALNASLKSEAALSEFDRNITDRNEGRLFSQNGNIIAQARSGEIDPDLSLSAGERITVAGVPVSARSGAPNLSDFLPSAGIPFEEDQRKFRDLRPDSQTLSLGGSYFTPIKDRLSLNASLNADITESESLRGLSNSQIDINAGNPFSPFANDITLFRADGPIIREATKSDIDANVSLFGDYPSRRWELTAQYNRIEDNRQTDRRIDRVSIDEIEDRIDAGDVMLNPFGNLGLNQKSISDRTANTLTLKGRLNARLMMLPAGPVTGSVGIEHSYTTLKSAVSFNGADASNALSRKSTEVRAQADIPLTGEWSSNGKVAGRSRLSLNASADKINNFGILKAYGAGVKWSVTDTFEIQAGADLRERAPSLSQLGNPVLVDPNIRVTDFETGQNVFIDRISGGNAALRAETRRDIQLTAKYRPSRALSMSTRYKSRITKDDITAFPFLTPQVAQAFPDRFADNRDASGNLLSLDARPVNAYRTQVDSLRTGFNWSKRFENVKVRAATEAERALETVGNSRRSRRERRRGGASSNRISLSVYHTLRLTEDFQFRRGGPVFDLLDGSALRRQGGEARHDVQARLSFKRKNYGGRIEVNHESGSFINTESLPPAQARNGNIVFAPLTTADVRFNYDLGRLTSGRAVPRSNWKSGMRLTLDIENITNAKQSVQNGNGITPFGYERDALDPEGRTVMISLRKIFMTRIDGKKRRG